jgi:HD-GYP domain-containing protein (c-di-GMP phosphodiesterase class II)
MTPPRHAHLLPFAVLAAASLLIVLLVHGIIRFGREVTDYYTPTILAFENLQEAAGHLSMEARSRDVTPQSVPFVHFHTALEAVERSLAQEHLEPHLSSVDAEHEPLLDEARALLQDILSGERHPDLVRLEEVEALADAHLEAHRAELRSARRTIALFATGAGLLCVLILALGARASLREYRAAQARERQSGIDAALRALVNALDARDPYTRGHSDRVADLAVRLAARLGLESRVRDRLQLAAYLHDVGKIGVADAILNKAGHLDEEEFAAMRTHPDIAARILEDFENLRDILPAVRHHHERWDGSGYPDNLRGEEIPMAARILALADAFDAMTSSRPYRPAMTPEQAAEEIRSGAGRQWPQGLARVFLDMLRDDPPPGFRR